MQASDKWLKKRREEKRRDLEKEVKSQYPNRMPSSPTRLSSSGKWWEAGKFIYKMISKVQGPCVDYTDQGREGSQYTQ